MKKLLILFIICNAIIVKAQETTIGKIKSEHLKDTLLNAREVLIIPFEKNMYRSDADNDIAQASGISVYELRAMLRNELIKHLQKALAGKKSSYHLLEENPSFKRDFEYINYSTAYKYQSLEGDKEKTNSGTQNGQIIGNSQTGNRYMNRIVSNPNVIDVIHKKYGAEYFIFINQMDIGPAPNTDQNDIMNENFNREIKVHYTILDKNGKELNSGIAAANFPFKKKKANSIVNDCFPSIAQKIILSLPN